MDGVLTADGLARVAVGVAGLGAVGGAVHVPVEAVGVLLALFGALDANRLWFWCWPLGLMRAIQWTLRLGRALERGMCFGRGLRRTLGLGRARRRGLWLGGLSGGILYGAQVARERPGAYPTSRAVVETSPRQQGPWPGACIPIPLLIVHTVATFYHCSYCSY
jgi:hypothetical protein